MLNTIVTITCTSTWAPNNPYLSLGPVAKMYFITKAYTMSVFRLGLFPTHSAPSWSPCERFSYFFFGRGPLERLSWHRFAKGLQAQLYHNRSLCDGEKLALIMLNPFSHEKLVCALYPRPMQCIIILPFYHYKCGKVGNFGETLVGAGPRGRVEFVAPTASSLHSTLSFQLKKQKIWYRQGKKKHGKLRRARTNMLGSAQDSKKKRDLIHARSTMLGSPRNRWLWDLAFVCKSRCCRFFFPFFFF